MALLAFRSSLNSDPLGTLASWNETLHLCQWRGVTCGGRRHLQRVTELDLHSLGLSGPIPTSIANLTFLRRLDLSNNTFHGHIPEEFGHLRRLHRLNLNVNSLTGGIPAGLGLCSSLREISLSTNMLAGTIPPSLSNLSSLQSLNVSTNHFEGCIPLWLANITSLTVLSLKRNSLVGTIPSTLGDLLSLQDLSLSHNHLEGDVPPALGSLRSLRFLHLTSNLLSGTFPSSICNLSSLIDLDLGDNQLSGTLPPDIGSSLPNLLAISLYDNQFHGPIPSSIANASALFRIQLLDNKLSGVLPSSLGNLKNLIQLILYNNLLEAKDNDDWSFLTALANCTHLKFLNLAKNQLGGVLPRAISNLSTNLGTLGLSANYISGSIPADINALVGVTTLGLGNNLLEGRIPHTIGMMQNLTFLDLSTNRFHGQIPSSISNLTRLSELYVERNKLQGSIPPSFMNLQHLQALILAHNKFSGSIPKELLSISSLSLVLDLSHNFFSGTLPTEVGHLQNLNLMDVSRNKLSGEIPITLGDCVLLEALRMRGNAFQGVIPKSFSKLRGSLASLDLSYNNLSGTIPEFLQNFSYLRYLNLAFNNFVGEVPKGGIFQNVSEVSILGNSKLCGGIKKLHLQACIPHDSKGHHRHMQLIIITIASSAAVCLSVFILYLVFLCYSKRKNSPTMTSSNELFARVTYSKLFKATEGFSPRNLIGVGSFGSVYKANMDPTDPNGKIMAVKVINLQQQGGLKSFMAECEALRSIRHRNLLKILTSCSSLDFNGRDFKALVFEFMPNRSLDQWLHQGENENEEKYLSLIQRLNIAVDVASAVAYLHHHNYKPIVHCDLKPSNVLDNDMIAHVSDFGLAKFVMKDDGKDPTSSMTLRGSIGYVAPEYGMGCTVTTEGDVFSYGVILLEMITGRRPTDTSFVNDLTLHKFVEMVFPEGLLDIVDPNLLIGDNKNAHDRRSMCLVSMARLGLICSKDSPKDRMEMESVTKEVIAIRNNFLGA